MADDNITQNALHGLTHPDESTTHPDESTDSSFDIPFVQNSKPSGSGLDIDLPLLSAEVNEPTNLNW